jgi:hypothetical protein
MRARLFLLVSLGLNLVLAGGWYFAVRQPAVKRPPVIRRPVTLTNIVRPIRTNLIISP